jgi:hypothetical protein
MEKQTTLIDPRHTLTLSYYKNPASETFGNFTQSAMRAGYDEATAKSLIARKPDWLLNSIKRDVQLIQKAEYALNKYASIKVDLNKDRDVHTREVAKMQIDVVKFILKTLARKKYKETDDNEIPQIQINVINYSKQGTEDNAPIKEAEYTSEP